MLSRANVTKINELKWMLEFKFGSSLIMWSAIKSNSRLSDHRRRKHISLSGGISLVIDGVIHSGNVHRRWDRAYVMNHARWWQLQISGDSGRLERNCLGQSSISELAISLSRSGGQRSYKHGIVQDFWLMNMKRRKNYSAGAGELSRVFFLVRSTNAFPAAWHLQ